MVEFATVIAVPLGASLLADLGARVIKVESLEGDPHRGMGVGLGAYVGASKTTASKNSICIDLKAPEGQRIAQQIIERSDIVIHNFRPGVPERLGIGYEQARALRPDIIYIPTTGYGPDGPSAHRPAAHPIPGAACGGALFQAGRDGAPHDVASVEELREGSGWLYGANETSPDPNTSVALASAAMLGLHARRRTGEGQQIFLSMLGANAYANYDDFLSYEGKPDRPTVDADVLGFSALYRLYPARSGWVMLAVTSDAQWQALCAGLGAARPGLGPALRDRRGPPRGGRRAGRGAHGAARGEGRRRVGGGADSRPACPACARTSTRRARSCATRSTCGPTASPARRSTRSGAATSAGARP